MVHKLVECPYCQGDQVVKRGKTDTGKQRYRCHTLSAPISPSCSIRRTKGAHLRLSSKLLR
jgi:hypothetical protein